VFLHITVRYSEFSSNELNEFFFITNRKKHQQITEIKIQQLARLMAQLLPTVKISRANYSVILYASKLLLTEDNCMDVVKIKLIILRNNYTKISQIGILRVRLQWKKHKYLDLRTYFSSECFPVPGKRCAWLILQAYLQVVQKKLKLNINRV